MADASHNAANFWTQADALLRKNLTYQKRRTRANCCLIFFPLILCLLLFSAQILVDTEVNKQNNVKCDCPCGRLIETRRCVDLCDPEQFSSHCPVPSPPQWPPLLKIPYSSLRAVRSNSTIIFKDLPNESCRENDSRPVTILVTGNNQSLGETLAGSTFTSFVALNSSNIMDGLANIALGSDSYFTSGFYPNSVYPGGAYAIYYVQRDCKSNSTLSFSIPQTMPQFNIRIRGKCVQVLNLWCTNSSVINEELYKGDPKGNQNGETNEFVSAYDLLNSNGNNFNVSIWYNPTFKTWNKGLVNLAEISAPRSVNLVSNAYLQFLHGSGTKMLFEFVKDMPRNATQTNLDISSVISPLFFTWVILLLFPVVSTSLVYEKQQKLRIMMKMHGLGDGPYWMISYSYFLSISFLYMLALVIFGSLLGLKFFILNDLSIQFVFYFTYLNLQITIAFLVAAFFSHVKIASVVGYICVFGTGLLGAFLFQNFVEDSSFPRTLIIALELYPGFSLYRGLYEFGQHSSHASVVGTHGMRWENLKDRQNGMKEVFYVMLIEWLAVLFVAYYMDKVLSSGSGKNPLLFWQNFGKKRPSSFRKPSFQRVGSKVVVDVDKPDVCQEREKVERLLQGANATHTIICDNLKKVYPGRDGNPQKMAVQGLSLALPPGECFGVLGPNGAGKTSFISMMIGLTKPTSGTAYIRGLDIRTQMDWIYSSMGVCPQHDLLWESLTGREHLLFYGRLKNLKGSALKQAVEKSLKSVDLYNGGVADKQAGKYSGGMKRRLSVAISLIGDPKVVYMDEPSTGLDPTSRRHLWNVVKQAKQGRAIILTTHSMEEADTLCDRLGVLVDGSLRCIGNPKELKARYGGTYVFTMTTSVDHEQQVANMVHQFSPNAERIYHANGTQKFEMPKLDVRIGDVFHAVEIAKRRFPVFAWGLSDTSLEDVFIKVVNGT